MKFEKFKPVNDFNYSSGWDKFALDYIHLPKQNRIYSFTKELLYKIIEKNIHLSKECHILDIGCGTGNDFSYFLSKGSRITAFDMSPGMLNKAYETYRKNVEDGQIALYQGHLEDFNNDSLPVEKFDLIFSVTGGLSYINNDLMIKIFRILKTMLKPHGIIITGHFSPFCLPEFIYYLLRLHLKSAQHRNKHKTEIEIKEEKMTMYFRSVDKLKGLFNSEFTKIRFYPLLAVTPPYQTGYDPGENLFNFHKKIERHLLDIPFFSRTADQTIMVMDNE